MKRAEDFREAFGPVDSGFNMVVNKTIEELKTKEQKKRPLTAVYPIRFRLAAAAAALVVLIGAGILGITSRRNGLEPTDTIRDERQYSPLTIEMALTQGSEPETAGGTTGAEILPAQTREFDPEKDVIQLPGEILSYGCTLPDGRILLTGAERTEKDYVTICKARLLCLNTDGTVSWEYTGPEKTSYLWFDNPAVLKDGTIAVKYDAGSPEIQFFTQEGVRLDKKMGPYAGNISWSIPHPSFLELERRDQEGVSTGIEVTDWDGNLITRIMEDQVFGDGFHNWMAGDELVLYGETGNDGSHAKIVKMDGLTDKVLWETVLDYQLPDTDSAGISELVKTEDGGYAALVFETKYGAAEGEDISRSIIVKLDADGRVRWVYRDDRQDDAMMVELCTYDGKLALVRTLGYDGGKEISIIASWIDDEGRKLGTTELAVQPEWFAKDLGSMLEAKADSKPRSLEIGSSEVFSAPDGLKVYLRAYVGIYYRDTNELGEVEGSNDSILIRIPETSGDADAAGSDDEEYSFLVRDDQINSAREKIAEAYPDLDLLNRAEYGYEGEIYEWGTEVLFTTHNISHGDVKAAVLTDGTVRLDSVDREPAGNVNTLFRRYQSAYGRISRWKQETWVQLAKDIESLELNDSDPDNPEEKLLKTARFPEENTVRITYDEAVHAAWEATHGEDEFHVMIDAEPHPVWKILTMAWPVKRLVEIDAETGEVVADELCDTGRTPAYALYSTEKNRRALELQELGVEAIARREAFYGFVKLKQEQELDLPEPDFDNPEEYEIRVNNRTVRFTGLRNDLKTFEVELDGNGYVIRCEITDSLSGRERTE